MTAHACAEYHRHEDGDVVRGSAERCIDPNAGARDVLVIEQGEMDDQLARFANLLNEIDGILGIVRHREARGITEQTRRDIDDARVRIRRLVG